ncbi:hypothetical protein FH966_07315 [Lentibacillus cibarius]|uniref:Bacterial Ig domain-containing protein n=1 Tax=Lentibacillus cibarius TaxID=2583219 RepID=A0A549YBH3_9BACI|nr:Ig-like domain-containing protein [Lentibacillus cibarius]TRM09234.1 hypothetical protein FH966_16315 [Lentibacillus cibarius]TRM11518.1 hypothetical protein FH966_07315 [Lentibacillus cibarius]
MFVFQEMLPIIAHGAEEQIKKDDSKEIQFKQDVRSEKVDKDRGQFPGNKEIPDKNGVAPPKADTEELENTTDQLDSGNTLEKLHGEKETTDKQINDGKGEEKQGENISDTTDQTQDKQSDVSASKEQSNGQKETNTESKPQGVAQIGLLEDTELNVKHLSKAGGEVIQLEYKGRGVLNVDVLSDTYSIFYLPSEIAGRLQKEDVTAFYDVPALSVIVPIIRNKGEFKRNAIHIEGNQVYMDFFNLLAVNLLSSSYFKFTLEIKLSELPPTENGEYEFYSQATSDVVDISVLSGENVATDTLQAPKLPEAPKMDKPVYTTDTVITGTGQANSNIIITTNHNEYEGKVDENGNFAVTIPTQKAGTTISGTIVNDQGYESKKTTVTVLEPPTLAFDHVPDTLPFQSVVIEPGRVTVPRKNPDWTIKVKDTRGEGSKWRLLAEVDKPLTSTDSKRKLTEALVFVDTQQEKHPLTNDPIEVFAAKTGANPITNVRWKSNQGPLIQVEPTDAFAGKYSTSITWTLVDAP